MDDALGPTPFRWTARTVSPGTFEYTPKALVSHVATGDDPDAVGASLWVHRTLWRNGRISRQPALVLHGGCGVSTPAGFETLGFNDGPDDFVGVLAQTPQLSRCLPT